MSADLSYSPKWHEVGDPDDWRIAFVYGAIAMATVWVVESLVHRALFSAGLSFSLSEVAALVTFKGSTWIDLLQWIQGKPCLGRDCPRTSRQAINRRAIFGVLLRAVVVALEIATIFAAVPREIEIRENQVGSSQVNFKGPGRILVARSQNSTKRPSLVGAACLPDRLRYIGFRAFASRQACRTALRLGSAVGSNPVFVETLGGPPRGAERFRLGIVKESGRFSLLSESENSIYVLQHEIRVSPGAETEDKVYILPLPKDIHLQARDAILESALFKDLCKEVTGSWADENIFLSCRPSLNRAKNFVNSVSNFLFNAMRTRKVRASFRKKSEVFAEEDGYLVVGTLSRPRLALFPALISLAILVIVNSVLILTTGNENLSIKLFHLAKEATGERCFTNPIYTKDRSLPMSRSIHGRNYWFGYVQEGSPMYGRDDTVEALHDEFSISTSVGAQIRPTANDPGPVP